MAGRPGYWGEAGRAREEALRRGEKYFVSPFDPLVMKHRNAAEKISGKRPLSFYEALHVQGINLVRAKSIFNTLAEGQHLDFRLARLEPLPPLEKFRRDFIAAKLKEYQKYRAQQP